MDMYSRLLRANASLPDEIIIYDILTHLSAKILHRFKFACKHWNQSISDPRFVNLHLERCRSQLHDYITSSTADGTYFSESTGDYLNFHKIFNSVDSIIPITSCDGLLVVCGSDRCALFICNPITMKSWELPSPKAFFGTVGDCSLVFDAVSNRYKVFRWYCDGSNHLLALTLGTEPWNWRELKLPGGPHDCISEYRKFLLKGKIYWVSFIQHVGSFLFFMDIVSEVIKEIELPDYDMICSQYSHCQLRVMELAGSIYFLHRSGGKYGKQCCYIIWILEDVENTKWTKLHQKRCSWGRQISGPGGTTIYCERKKDLEEIENEALADWVDDDDCKIGKGRNRIEHVDTFVDLDNRILNPTNVSYDGKPLHQNLWTKNSKKIWYSHTFEWYFAPEGW